MVALAAGRLWRRRLQHGKAEVDRSLFTSSTAASALPSDQDRASDQTTIGNAASSADLEQLGGQAVPWANAGTGSRGSITELVELKDNGQTCRSFTASREASMASPCSGRSVHRRRRRLAHAGFQGALIFATTGRCNFSRR